MNQRYNSSKLSFLIVTVCLFSMMNSCTFDYFEDETNYVVYVPKADRKLQSDTYRIEDLSILIYDTDLEKERYSDYPFSENPRSKEGNFNFRVLPKTHAVFCFTNAQKVIFSDLSSLSTATFGLQKSSDGYYTEPPPIYAEYFTPTIHYPGPVVMDTARFERLYVGRICVVFKKMTKLSPALTFDNIKKVSVIAKGVGVVQKLSQLTDSVNTRSTRYTDQDKMLLGAILYKNPYRDFEFGFQNYYLPFPFFAEGDKPVMLSISFIGENNNVLYTLDIEVADANLNPITLHMNETLVVEVDGNNIQILHLKDIQDWSPDIESGGNSSPGGGGVEM